MTGFYLVRHGATKLNGQDGVSIDRERGWSDVPLTLDGRRHAQKAGLLLRSKGIGVIAASDLDRAQETATVIKNILGVEVKLTKGLRPWNLGDLTGKEMKQVTPVMMEYVKDKPNQPVSGGESFNTFKNRAFDELSSLLHEYQNQKLLIISHHRVERLLHSYIKAGQPKDRSIDVEDFFLDGDPPGGVVMMNIDEKKLGKGKPTTFTNVPSEGDDGADVSRGSKFTHREVNYGMAKASGDRCSVCRSYKGPDDCIKVVNPIYPGGWCKVGHGKTDGHPFSKEADDPEYNETAAQEGAEKPAKERTEQAAGQEIPRHHSALAIGGAHHLHKAGLINTKQRDKFQQQARVRLARAALRG